MFYFCFLFIATHVYVHTIDVAPKSLTLGFIGPTNLPNTNTQTGGHPALFAVKLAIQEINARSDLLPRTKLKLIINNTNSDAGTGAVVAFWQCIFANVIGIIGEYTSVVSQSIQYASRYYKVPQISYGSTSSEFTKYHQSQYPYFLRTTPNQNTLALSLSLLIVSQQWKNIAVLYTTDSQMFHSAQEFLNAARRLNIQILASISFAAGTKNLTTQMNTLKQSRARIILFIGTIIDQQLLIENSMAAGLFGVGYQWIAIQASMYRALYTNAAGVINRQYYNWSQGLIGLQIVPDTNSNVYQEYARQWFNAAYDPETSTIERDYISPIANFAYDACLMFAYALHYMIEKLNLNPMTLKNRDLFLDILKNTSFFGVSGAVKVDSNGDRILPFDIVNFQGNQIVKIGSIDKNGQVRFLNNVPILYMGGTRRKPLDLPVRSRIQISTAIIYGMITGSILCTLLCLALVVFTCYFRENPVIKGSSSIFLCLMLTGVISLALSIVPRALENSSSTPVLCISELFLANIGYSLIIGTLLLKTYRLAMIFRMSLRSKKYHLKDKYLLMILAGLITISAALLIGLCTADPFYITKASNDMDNYYQYCASKNQLKIYMPLILSSRFALLLLTTFCAYKIRKLPHLFNETRQLVFTVYNLSFLSIALPTIDLVLGRGKDLPLIAYGICTFLICILTPLIMFVPKIILMKKFGNKRRCSSTTFGFRQDVSSLSMKKKSSSQTSIQSPIIETTHPSLRRNVLSNRTSKIHPLRSLSWPSS